MKQLFVALFLAVSASALAQNGGNTEEIRKLEMGWVEAVKSGDYARLDQILSKDLVYTHATGIREDKGEYLGKLKTGDQKYASIEHSDLKAISFNGNTAVVAAKVHMTGATKGVPFDNRVLMTHVWVKQGGKWQLVAHQTTRVP